MRRIRWMVKQFARRSGIRCALRGRCDAERHHLGMGGVKCRDCAAVGASYDELDPVLDSRVIFHRRLWDRDTKTLTRTDAWGPGRRGW